MKIDYQEARALLREAAEKDAKQKGEPPRRPTVMDAGLLKQALIATEHLTASPEWNVFLQRVQAKIEESRQALSQFAHEIGEAALTSEQILQLQRRIIERKAKIDAWETVLALPKEILEAKAETPPAA